MSLTRPFPVAPPTIQIEELPRKRIPEAARVLARAFVSNPLHVATFGPEALAANETFFRAALAVLKGPKWIATAGGEIRGFNHWVDSGACQLPWWEQIALTPLLLRLGYPAAPRVLRWQSAWAARDPHRAHVHLGPIGVAPEAQSTGIGRALMARYCAELDRSGASGYLETDRQENVAFYRRFGFETTSEAKVLGVDCTFMWRPARPAAP